ncbi:MAG: extracellular solute-binding protein [Ruminococcaceae bacterium]|nr:extracellular solute-binding protein [Oscillospiraceae bacterium]
MKRRNSILSLLLAAMMVLPSMAACSDAPAPADDTSAAADTTTAEETTAAETELTDGLGDVNMDGFTMNILHHNTEWLTWTVTQLDAEEMTSDLINDAIYTRNDKIQNRFNAKIKVTGEKTPSGMVASIVQSGDATYDIIYLYGVNTFGNVDYLADMDSIPHLSLDKEWWNPPATDVFRVGDKQIAIAGNLSLSYISGTSAWMMNKDIYKNLQLKDDVYQLVKDGKWTQDKFFEICRKAVADLDGDGKTDRIGTGASSLKAYVGALTQGAGYTLVTKDKEGYPVFEVLKNESLINYMQDLLELYKSEPTIYSSNGQSIHGGDTGIDFAEGDCLFSEIYLINIADYRDKDVDFAILPTPKLNEEQSQYLTRSSIGEIATLPRSADAKHYENVGILLEALSFDSQWNLLPAYKEVLLKARLARDNESSDMLDYVFRSVAFDAGRVCWELEINNPINEVYQNQGDNLVSTLTSLTSSVNKIIKDFVEKVKAMP